ncbi:MAG TPA: hypothetical protein VF092_19415 [Longimicrobium sp.]
MTRTRISIFTRTLAAVALCVVAAAGCEDLGTGEPHQRGQYQVLITDEATGLAYAQVFADGSVQGGITLAAGTQKHLVLRLLTSTNTAVGIGPGDEIRINLTNTVVASFHVDSQQGGVIHGTLTGGSAGATTLRLQYIQAGFTEYESPAVNVTVT